MKNKLILLLLIFITLFSILISCEVERSFFSKDINNFLDELSDKYDYIDKTKVKSTAGHIKIRIYFESIPDIAFDETIHEEIQTFFKQTDVQEKFLKKHDKSSLDGAYYAILLVEFIDTIGTESHQMESPIDFVDYRIPGDKENRYGEWTDPFYYEQNE